MIELERFAVIRGVGDSVDIATSLPSISESGHIAVERIDPPSNAIAIYDSGGTYLYSVGRSGGGPGEFSRVSSFGFGRGDSLWVLDGLFVGHVFAPPPGRAFNRKAVFEHPMTGRITDRGILSSPSIMNSQFVHPRLITWDSADTVQYMVPDDWANEAGMGAVGWAATDRLWVASGTHYEIIQVADDGKVLQRIRRDADWFPPQTGERGFPTVTRPKPWIMAVSSGPDSLLWVLVRRAHRNWEANRSPGSPPRGPVPLQAVAALSLTKLFEGVVEVFDQRTGELLASRDVSGGALGFVRPGILHEVVELESGANELHLWRLRLKR